MSMERRRQRALQSSSKARIVNGTLYLSIDVEHLRNAGMFPQENPETIPERLTYHYLKGGERDGTIEIDLADQAVVTDGEE